MRLKFGSLLVLVSLFSITYSADQAPGASRLKIEQQPNKLVIRAQPSGKDWIDLATYVIDPAFRPYFHPLYDPSGTQVLTQDRPDDHPWQHGIFTGFHRVNGFNYWKEDEGRQRFVRLKNVRQEGDSVQWTSLVELVAPNGDIVLEEENAITVHAPKSDSYLVNFELVLRARGEDVAFGKFFVGGLSVRMPWDKENPRQTHLNSEGLIGRAAEQKRAAWCTVERPFGAQVFGIAIFDHPTNPNHPPSWRVDEQGLINPNVSGLADWSIPANQERRFRYQLLMYRGTATMERLHQRFEHFSRAK